MSRVHNRAKSPNSPSAGAWERAAEVRGPGVSITQCNWPFLSNDPGGFHRCFLLSLCKSLFSVIFASKKKVIYTFGPPQIWEMVTKGLPYSTEARVLPSQSCMVGSRDSTGSVLDIASPL